MSTITNWIDRRYYPDHQDNWDDWLLREQVGPFVKTGAVVLDLGAGAGVVEQLDFRGLGARIFGVDLDPRVIDNPMLDEGRVANAEAIPYPDATFDIVFADNLLEHLVTPLVVFREVARVLKPGGVFVFKTPNKWHYVAVLASLTPHRFHQFYNKLRGRPTVDTFPTCYLANSRRDVLRLAQGADLKVEALETVEGRPEYLRIAAPMYLFGLAYERTVNAGNWLAPFRVILIGRLRKGSATR